ncbi:MAG: DeoR/GlpR family DNA-binding transcription regulator [Clostridia bacterium]|nr:DeoR/GlpR family DNA-binding transcription regulator [Clostridia bacterium]
MTFERVEKIKTLLQENGTVTLHGLQEIFPQVTSMTLRRDLERLEKEGVAIKIRGGAKAAAREPDTREPVYSLRVAKNIEAKLKIANRALPFLETGRSVYLDSGSTIMCLASVLPDIKLMVMTSGPNIALEVLKSQRATVNIVGGLISHDNLSISGKQALDFIKNINIDIAFIAPSGFSIKDGFTCGNYAEADLKRSVIKKANRVIMLMDSHKTEKSLTYTFASPKDIDTLITDTALPKALQRALTRAGAETIVV